MSRLELFKNRILWKIYVVWFFRRVAPLILVQVAILALVLKIFAKNVFVSKVLQNSGLAADGGYWTVLKFLALAFARSHLVVQVAILIIFSIGALLLRDIVRSILAYKSMWVKKS